MFTGFILFLIVAIGSFIARSRTSVNANTRIDNHKIYGIIFRIASVLALVFLVLSTATIVPAGNVGVQVLYGNVEPPMRSKMDFILSTRSMRSSRWISGLRHIR